MAYRRPGNSHVLCGREIRASTSLNTDLIQSLTGSVNINAMGGLKVNGERVNVGRSELVAEIYNTDALCVPGESRGISLPVKSATRLTGNIGMSYDERKGIWLDELGIYELSSTLLFNTADSGVLESYFEYTGNSWRKYGYDTQNLSNSGVLKNYCVLEHTDIEDSISLKISNSSEKNVELNTDSSIGWSWTIKYVGKLKNIETKEKLSL